MSDWYNDPELATRVANGWVPFGFHVGYPGSIHLEFDGEGADGMPIWERLVPTVEEGVDHGPE